MSKARAIADSSDFAAGDNLDGGLVDALQDGNVYNTIDSTGTQTFDGDTADSPEDGSDPTGHAGDREGYDQSGAGFQVPRD